MSWQWFALKVAPGKEFAAERVLRDDGFDVFVPLKHVPGRGNRRLRLKTVNARPRYPGYVFIGFCRPDIPWFTVMRFRMIHGVISDNGKPFAFAEADIRGLAITSSRPIRYMNRVDTRRRRRRGDQAKVASGPYQGRDIRCIQVEEEVELYELVEPYLAKIHASE